METKIDLKGIVRNTSKLNSPVGSCHEIINLRKKYGSWRPILPKLAIKENFVACDGLFIHTTDEFEYYITYETDGKIKAYSAAGILTSTATETLLTLSAALDLSFSSLGDFLIISDLTNFTKYIFRCSPSGTPKYKDVSNIPALNLKITNQQTINTFEYVCKRDQESFLAAWWLLDEEIRGNYPDYFEGYVFLRYAIEMIDGTTLKLSEPVFLYNGNVSLTDHPVSDPTMYMSINTYLFEIDYQIQAVLPTGWADYKNLIRGVSVFMTKPVSKYDLEQSGLTTGDVFVDLYEKPNLLTDLFRNESLYYRVFHIPFNTIVGGGTGAIGRSTPIKTSPGGRRVPFSPRSGTGSAGDIARRDSPSTLTQYRSVKFGFQGDLGADRTYNPNEFNINDITSYEILNVSDTSHHNILGINSLTYNSRLFLGDTYTRLFDGYNISHIVELTGGALAEFDIWVEVDLETTLGKRTVMQTMKSTKDSIKVPLLIGYPDIRATELRIIHNQTGSLLKTTFSLEGHPVLNIATATMQDGVAITTAAKDTDGYLTITIANIDVACSALTTVSSFLRDKNRIQLTELYNPFITPALYSYQVGDGNIVGIAVNMLPLDDKFGTFPVFVFTSRGIWALNLSDTGSVVVSNIAPVSDAICTNKDSIITINNLLVFLASDGIKLLSGQTPAEISDIAEGPILSALSGNVSYGEIKAQTLLNDVAAQLSSVDLLAYSEEARFAFDKIHREIIVSNYDYDYSYVFSLDEKLWYKCSQKFKRFINSYPNTYALSTGNDLVDISQEDTTGDVGVFIETRPVLLGPDREVKLHNIVLGGVFDVAADKNGGFFLFGSNDASTWALLTGKEISGGDVFNIKISKLPISIRYLIAVFSGTITEKSSLNEIRIVIP